MNNIAKKLSIVWLLSTCSCLVHSQSLDYAFGVIDTLCSPQMYGRGYIDNGQKQAAHFIENEFIKIGLAPLGMQYQQSFEMAINTFPSQPSVILNGAELVLGVDYILSPNCGSGSGEVKLLTYTDFQKMKKKRKVGVLLTAEEYMEIMGDAKKISEIEQGAVVVKINTKKLTASLSTSSIHVPVIEILAKEIPLKADITFSIDTKVEPSYEAQNVIGMVKGTTHPDSVIIFCAHYDHLGGMGDIYFPGANDNAAGVAMILELAQYYANNPHPYSTFFIAFGAEEAGLVGSRYFVNSGVLPLDQISFVMNLDLVGTGQTGITVVNGKIYEKEYQQMVDINDEKHYLESIQPRGKAANSDHYYFSENGVPSFFIYGRGEPGHYHDINDNGADLELAKFKEIEHLIIDFMHERAKK